MDDDRIFAQEATSSARTPSWTPTTPVPGSPARPSMAIDLTIRRTTHDNIPAVLGFLEGQPEPHLVRRPPAEHHQAVRDGLHFLALDARSRVVATGAVFVSGDVAEFGGMRVHREFRGFRLHMVFLRIRAVAIEAAPAAYGREAYTAVDPGNIHAAANVVDEGFERWANPAPAVFGPCGDCPKREAARRRGQDCCCDFLRPSIRARLDAAIALRDGDHPLELVHSSDGRVIRIDLDLDFFQRPALDVLVEEIACRRPAWELAGERHADASPRP